MHAGFSMIDSLSEKERLLYELISNSLNSRVVRAYAKNFMSVQEGSIQFDESGNIIQLVGYNDSGKSAMLTVLPVIFYDFKANQQVDMIHDSNNAKEFEVGVEFSDGVVISKIKRITGESIWSFSYNGELLYTNKKDTGIIAVKGVPEVIRKYNKAIYEENTKEYVNYRRNRDKLFLVHTGNGDNAKIINGLMHMETINEATQRLNKEKNRLLAELGSLNSSIGTLKYQVQRIDVMSMKDETTVEKLTEKLQSATERLVLISKMAELREKIENNRPMKEIHTVDVSRLEQLQQLVKLREEMDKGVIPELTTIDTSRLDAIKHLITLRDNLNREVYPVLETVDTSKLDMLKRLEGLRNCINNAVYPNVERVDISKLTALQNLNELSSKLKQAQETLRLVTEEEQAITAKMEEYKVQYDIRTCKNCGMLMEKEA